MKLKELINEYIDNCGEEILNYFFVSYQFLYNGGKKEYAVKQIKTVIKELPLLLNCEVDHISEGENFFKVFYLKEKIK